MSAEIPGSGARMHQDEIDSPRLLDTLLDSEQMPQGSSQAGHPTTAPEAQRPLRFGGTDADFNHSLYLR